MTYQIFRESGQFQVKDLETREPVGKPFASRGEAAGYLNSLQANSMVGSLHFEADALNPRILHFKNYVLARPETNKNQDDVDQIGIRQLADTIAGMPIDLDHDAGQNVGFFTAGRVGADGELRVDGSVWLDRCELNGVDPQDVYDGKYGMSIEADATSAECSVCHAVHYTEADYCEHIQVQENDGGIRAKMKHGAKRIMRGLRALGGAFTYRPAGSGTGADQSSRIMFAAMEVTMSNLNASEIAELWINEMAAEIKRRDDVSDADKKRAEKEYGDVEYADPKNKKYPIDKDHVHQAWSYINMPKNAEKYSSDELEAIKNRIKRAAKKYGMEISEDTNKEKAAMADEDEKKETPEEEKKETPAEEKQEKDEGKEQDMKAEYEATKKLLAEMTANYDKANQEKAAMETQLQAAQAQLAEVGSKLEAAQAELQKANSTIVEARANDLRARLVGAVLTEEEFEAEKESLLAAPAKHIELMLKNVKVETPTNQGRLSLAAQEQTTDESWVLC